MELLYQDAQIAVCIKPQGVLSGGRTRLFAGAAAGRAGQAYIRSTDWTAM